MDTLIEAQPSEAFKLVTKIIIIMGLDGGRAWQNGGELRSSRYFRGKKLLTSAPLSRY